MKALPTNVLGAIQFAVSLIKQNKYIEQRGTARAEAEQIVCEAMRRVLRRSVDRAYLYLHPQEPISEELAEKIRHWALARGQGRLLQHLLEYVPFGRNEYRVNQHVLIPRPETELLVEIVSARLAELFSRKPFFFERPWSSVIGLEVGLGSGVISIEILDRFKQLRMIATEASRPAIDVAAENAKRILGEQAGRLSICFTDSTEVIEPLVSALGGQKACFFVSNPPYLLEGSCEAEQEVVEQEPALALFAPKSDPLFFYREFAQKAFLCLYPGAPLWVEIPHERSMEIKHIFDKNGWCDVQCLQDLSGRDRFIAACAPVGDDIIKRGACRG